MLKISDFSHVAHVSGRMLRHYDERGLLKPAYKALISSILKTHRLEALPGQKPVQHYRGIGMPRNGIQMRVVRL